MRDTCSTDGRGCFAVLTDEGAQLLAGLRATHLDGVRERFLRHFEASELETMAAWWDRVVPRGGVGSQSRRLR